MTILVPGIDIFGSCLVCYLANSELFHCSFGLTSDLFGFWKKSGYVPLYIRQTANSITGEHSCIMVKALNSQTVSPEWLSAYLMDFKRRFITLLGYNFRAMPAKLAFSVLVSRTTGHAVPKPVNKDELMQVLTEHDLRRLDSYSRNLLDYHAVMDLIPPLARLFFLEKIPIDLSPGQRVILLGFGAQFKTVEQLAVGFSKGPRKHETCTDHAFSHGNIILLVLTGPVGTEAGTKSSSSAF